MGWADPGSGCGSAGSGAGGTGSPGPGSPGSGWGGWGVSMRPLVPLGADVRLARAVGGQERPAAGFHERIISRRSEGFRRRGQGVPATFSGTSKTTAPDETAVSMHLFDRSFTPEMDDTEQRASSRTTGRGGVPCSGENARAWLRGVLTFRGDHLLGFVGGRGFRGTVGAVAEPLDLGDGLGGHEDAAPAAAR